MNGINVNIILLIIIFLLVILDILRNIEFLKSKNMFVPGIFAYVTFLIFFICFIFYPSNTFLLVSIIAIAIIPNSYYWYNRTTKGKRRTEAIIMSILFLAGIMYYLAKLF